jgi:helix-turn-helix, Psq domain
MIEKRAKKGKINPKSSQPYKRRTEEEMINILSQIQNGSLSKRSACLKYGINRNTLSLFILKQSAAKIIINDAVDLTSIMNDNQKNTALVRKVKELSAELEKSKLKVLTLETMIEVAEEDLNIKIRKKSGTKQLKK